MSNHEDSWRDNVEDGIAELNRTGQDACVILKLEGSRPINEPIAGSAEHIPIAAEHGLFIVFEYVVTKQDNHRMWYSEYYLLSKKPQLTPEEIKAIVPGYQPKQQEPKASE